MQGIREEGADSEAGAPASAGRAPGGVCRQSSGGSAGSAPGGVCGNAKAGGDDCDFMLICNILICDMNI